MNPDQEFKEAGQRRFLQYSSHALQTPLMIIGGYAQSIELGLIAPDKGAGIILDQCRKLSSLIDKMLQFSNLEDRPAIKPDVLSLGKAVAQYLDRFAFASGETRIYFDPSPMEEDSVLACEDLLELILDNLLTNAQRYARNSILVTVHAGFGRLCLSVADDGNGIPPQVFPHLFDLFYKGRDGQHGLGLAIAREAAEQMNAELSAANRPEGGAVFTLRLKKAAPSP